MDLPATANMERPSALMSSLNEQAGRAALRLTSFTLKCCADDSVIGNICKTVGKNGGEKNENRCGGCRLREYGLLMRGYLEVLC